MPRQTNASVLEYVLIALVVFFVLTVVFSPIPALVADGAKLAIALINGDAATIGSLLPAAK
jgi:hypothetical protein